MPRKQWDLSVCDGWWFVAGHAGASLGRGIGRLAAHVINFQAVNVLPPLSDSGAGPSCCMPMGHGVTCMHANVESCDLVECFIPRTQLAALRLL